MIHAPQDELEESPNSDTVIRNLRLERKPRLFIISGPSAVGKDSIVVELRSAFPDIHVAVTATSRERRGGECDGVDYFFYSSDRFREKIKAGDFLEHDEVYGHLYGVPRQSVTHALERGQDVIVKVDVKGAATIRNAMSDSTTIFIAPESRDQLLKQLQHRKTEEFDTLMRRFEEAERELQRASEFDYVVFNEHDEQERISRKAIDQISAIIVTERLRSKQNPVTFNSPV